MQAIVLRQGGQVAVETLSDPEPGPGEVLIAVRASGICHTDIEILRGNYGASAFPLVPGHEYAGEVLALGAGVTGFAAGDLVVVDPNIGCGTCPGCRAGRVNLCESLGAYGVTRNGGFAERCVVRADALVPAPGMDPALAALAEPMGCVLNGLSPLAGRRIDRALVFGAGPIGMLMGIALRQRGAEAIMVDLDEDRLAMAAEFGLGALAQGTAELERLRHGCDLAVDATGVPAVAARLPEYAANGGNMLYFGVCPPAARIEISPFEIFRRQLSLFGTHSLNHNIAEALEVIQACGPGLGRLITHRLPLPEVARLFGAGTPRGAMKVLMDTE
ncbi:zinc-dependent alcohol dehydrogenase family protein [Paracoccus denitrificans]|jgi:threonine dehydrogenase-like Zn-dependent dehydrogenase|uniref:Alcohol dehydrogenase GroES domain protein n=1 Tax=Paracoccus denitrificans (strain Pd 1222) TaxID=318586 RepID=A1BBK6_PARDP|nr:zinc-dependent alcohol dehydrogenase family protein [Paracoccus denitrificans]ABL72900.1 Alcohol dehydrogenase GroES domain protein [Paracoccus denitrificans PD1222]MBB4626379.1 threonine dehydrogenase-like Zn-dependent dehydrogenase [Paracoccus denitrificans]MCU7427416.1 zinc-dependent alcohol dehydrogenase family protein [Paracoccus denitrificans]QAR29306.1 zinc-binding dehydrogenase [Paracoccus denitrificans]UPV98365.1 zinc-dependent alcohol dehydrogenase family protein [Paracoccus denit